MVNFHGWDMEAFENLMVFEREVYVQLLNNHLEEVKAAQGKGSATDYEEYIRSFEGAEKATQAALRPKPV